MGEQRPHRDLPVAALQARLRAFAASRDWNQFHTPKNLSMALAGEAGELLEIFQWLTADESERLRFSSEAAARVADEAADILIYLLQLADSLDIDLAKAIEDKLTKNAANYPEDVVKGTAVRPPRATDA